MAKSNKKLVLLDVHAIVHRAYHALPEFVSSKGVPTGALYGLSTMLLKIIEETKYPSLSNSDNLIGENVGFSEFEKSKNFKLFSKKIK